MYGGIRGNVGVSGRFSTGADVGGTGPMMMMGPTPGAAGTGRRQIGSPYVTAAPTGTTMGPPTYLVVVGLVVAELLALVALRNVFKHHHGG
jgi:hypothetical protein